MLAHYLKEDKFDVWNAFQCEDYEDCDDLHHFDSSDFSNAASSCSSKTKNVQTNDDEVFCDCDDIDCSYCFEELNED